MDDYLIFIILFQFLYALHLLWRFHNACDRIADMHEWLREDYGTMPDDNMED